MKKIYKKVTALSVSRYLFSLDLGREYFSDEKVEIVDKKKEYKSKPIIGSFRLNKMLQIIQALHYAYYKKPLFHDEMKAFEHGGIIKLVCRNFRKLYKEEKVSNNSKSLKEEQKEFINKIFFYLRDNYSDRELRDLAHEDLAWMKAWKRRSEGGTDEFVYDKEVLNYYEKLSSSMLRAMKIKTD